MCNHTLELHRYSSKFESNCYLFDYNIQNRVYVIQIFQRTSMQINRIVKSVANFYDCNFMATTVRCSNRIMKYQNIRRTCKNEKKKINIHIRVFRYNNHNYTIPKRNLSKNSHTYQQSLLFYKRFTYCNQFQIR